MKTPGRGDREHLYRLIEQLLDPLHLAQDRAHQELRGWLPVADILTPSNGTCATSPKRFSLVKVSVKEAWRTSGACDGPVKRLLTANPAGLCRRRIFHSDGRDRTRTGTGYYPNGF